jgi:hypothetical protein
LSNRRNALGHLVFAAIAAIAVMAEPPLHRHLKNSLRAPKHCPW